MRRAAQRRLPRALRGRPVGQRTRPEPAPAAAAALAARGAEVRSPHAAPAHVSRRRRGHPPRGAPGRSHAPPGRGAPRGQCRCCRRGSRARPRRAAHASCSSRAPRCTATRAVLPTPEHDSAVARSTPTRRARWRPRRRCSAQAATRSSSARSRSTGRASARRWPSRAGSRRSTPASRCRGARRPARRATSPMWTTQSRA